MVIDESIAAKSLGGGVGGGVELSPPIKISGGAKAPQPPILYAYM